MIITTYQCDVCGRRGEGAGKRLPNGWSARRWVPGILQAPGQPTPPDQHYCGPECAERARPEAEPTVVLPTR